MKSVFKIVKMLCHVVLKNKRTVLSVHKPEDVIGPLISGCFPARFCVSEIVSTYSEKLYKESTSHSHMKGYY